MTDIVCSTLMAIRMVESLCSESVPFSLFFGDLQSCMVSMSLRRFHRSRSSTSLSFSLSSLVLTIRCHIFGQLATSLSSASSHWTSLFAFFSFIIFPPLLAAIINFKVGLFQSACLVRCLFARHTAVTSFCLAGAILAIYYFSRSKLTLFLLRHCRWSPS